MEHLAPLAPMATNAPYTKLNDTFTKALRNCGEMVNLWRRRFFSYFDTITIIMKELSRADKFKLTSQFAVNGRMLGSCYAGKTKIKVGKIDSESERML